jgi:uncharacterized protein (TIGR02145 family)
MVIIKVLLAGLIGVSLCMADISGIVTDTGTTPITAAVVRLEKGGQTATTGSDGRFTIIVSTAILPGNAKLLPNGLSAGISGNMLNVTIAERSVVEVSTYDLSGKALLTVRHLMDAGSHCIALPGQGAGIYLYKVKAGNNESVLKGNTVGGMASERSQGSSSKPLAKHAMSASAINDVIAAIKAGYLNYRVVAYNSDTTGIQIKMIECAGTVTDADGNVYQTVRIGNQVWMAENFRTTKYNDGSDIPLDTSTTTWADATTQKYCYYNNTTDSGSIKKYGALYNWFVVSPANPKKVAPTGWHVPSDSEWTILEKYLILNGYNWDGTTDTSQYNRIAKSLSAKTDWNRISSTGASIGYNLSKNNRSGFSALPGGFRDYNGFFNQFYFGYWWSATEIDGANAWYRYLYYDCERLLYWSNGFNYQSFGLSVRLLRD